MDILIGVLGFALKFHAAVTLYVLLSLKIKPLDYSEITPGMDLLDFAHRHKLRIVRKDKWGLSVLISKVLPLRDFQSNYWTTIGRTMGYSTRGPDLSLEDPNVACVMLKEMDLSELGRRPREGNVTSSETLELLDYLNDHRSTVEHEYHHVLQWERFGWIWGYAYLLSPIPIGFAWFRWLFERVPYAYQARAGYRSWEKLAPTIAKAYWCWPKTWMNKWFHKEKSK